MKRWGGFGNGREKASADDCHIDSKGAAANRWNITEEMRLLSAQGGHYWTPDVVCYVNGIPLAVIEAKRRKVLAPAPTAP